MPRTFISYRRSDSSTISGRIYDHLADVFGESNVFKDVYDIPVGSDFRKVIEDNINACHAQLIVIGPTWLETKAADGTRRLDDPDDAVRIEVESGLTCRDILLIPVLVSGATMPKPEDLPESMRDLSFRNAIFIRDDPDFRGDIGNLIKALRELEARETTSRWRQRAPYVVGLVAAALIVAVAAGIVIANNQGTRLDVIVSDRTGTHVLVILPTAQGRIDTTIAAPTPVLAPTGLPQPTLSSVPTDEVTPATATATVLVTPNVAGAATLISQADNLRAQGNYPGALYSYTKAILLDPENSDAYIARGWANYDAKHYSDAIADFSTVIEKNPQLSVAYLGRGASYREAGNMTNAFADLTQAITTAPGSADAYYERGYTHQMNGDNSAARDDFSAALKIDPDYVNAYIQFAWLNLTAFHDPDSALQQAQRAVALAEANPYAQAALGDADYALGKKQDALIHYRRYQELMGSDADPKYLALIHELESS